jgi:hypothetical protein
MSILCISRVLNQSRATNAARLVLIVVADFADDQGYAYPSVETLARKALITERTAQRAIAELIEIGELRVDRQAGMRGCNLYQVLFPDHRPATTPPTPQPASDQGGDKNDRGDNLSGVTISTGGGDNFDVRGRQIRQEGVTKTTPEPSENRHRTVIEPPKARKRAKGVQGELGIAPGPAPDPTADIPPNWSLELRQAWSDWSEHRRQSRKPLTAIARRQQIAQLSRWTEAESIANIKRSINAGWSGIFPERTQQPRRGGPVREGEFTKAF